MRVACTVSWATLWLRNGCIHEYSVCQPVRWVRTHLCYSTRVLHWDGTQYAAKTRVLSISGYIYL